MWKEIIDKNLIIINPDVKNKKELFDGMVNHVYNKDYVINLKKFLDALYDREEKSNTELAPGVAFPHARTNAADKLFVSIIIIKDGIDYQNPDMGKAKIIFFFGCPEGHNKQYLQLLAQSSRLSKNPEFKEKILNCMTPDDVVDLLNLYDESDELTDDEDKYILVITLNDTYKSADVMSAMVEVGITNASIIDSTSMSKKLAYEMPLFAGLSYMSSGRSKRSQVILCHISNKETAVKLEKIFKENDIDLNKPGVGFMQLIKIDSIIGNFEEDIEL